jgi:hypothetical protein
MPGVMPGLHVVAQKHNNKSKTWMAGTSPAMTSQSTRFTLITSPPVALMRVSAVVSGSTATIM